MSNESMIEVNGECLVASKASYDEEKNCET